MKIKISGRKGILRESSEIVTYKIKKITETVNYISAEDITDFPLTSEEWEMVLQAVREKYTRVQTEKELKVWGIVYRKLGGGQDTAL